MRTLARVCLLAAWAAQAPAWAQTAAPATPASAAEAAMERARRQAASPLRIILEASKTRRKPGDAETGEATDAAGQRSVNTRSAPLTSATGTLEAAAARMPQPIAVEAPVETQVTLSSTALQTRARTAPTVAIESVVPASAVAALPAPAEALPPPAPPAQAAPKLITMVEPVLPVRVFEEAGGLRELPVDLTIRADGSVASVNVAVTAPRQLVRAVVAALGQWRFEPLPAERVHRVQLVFGTATR